MSSPDQFHSREFWLRDRLSNLANQPHVYFFCVSYLSVDFLGYLGTQKAVNPTYMIGWVLPGCRLGARRAGQRNNTVSHVPASNLPAVSIISRRSYYSSIDTVGSKSASVRRVDDQRLAG